MRRSIGIAVVLLGLVACGRGGVPGAPALRNAADQSPAAAARGAEPRVQVAAAFVAPGELTASGEGTAKTKLAIERVVVDAKVTGDVAETTVEHVFRNDGDRQLEGTFRFPLPSGAILTGLAMEIDGKLMEGELVERDKARKAYEQVVDSMLDPALLEWENGRTFKLRVFPILPHENKRVVLRFVAPLHRDGGALYFAYREPSADLGLGPERMRVVVDGKPVTGATRAATGEMLLRLPGDAPALLAERTKDGAYYAAHVEPAFAEPAKAPDKPQALVLLCDRSRSMLEARELQARAAAMLLAELGPKDMYAVVTGDVSARVMPGGLRPASEGDKGPAIAFLEKDEPDGASDVGKLLAAGAALGRDARARGLEPVFVYLGDATATWGETRSAALESQAKAALEGAPMHVMVLGRSTDEPNARALAAATHGRLLHPKTEADARLAASRVVHAREARRMDDVKLVGADGVDLPIEVPGTIYEGDDVALAFFVPSDKPAPRLALAGKSGGKDVSAPLDLAQAKAARDVGKRWAKAKIEKLEAEGDKNKEAVVKTSLDHGVMSKYTSFLVLESEEAYARFQIARKAKATGTGDPAVSGRDLDGSGRSASVTPDHLQPGDPEVRIPAPADAQSVVVVFPFGETKNAAFEMDSHGGAWVVRFLVDRATPDGTYEIVARVTHKDGRVEIVKLPYVVDTQTPHLAVTVTPKAHGAFEIRAKQELSAAEIEAQTAGMPGTLEQKRVRYAHVLTDAKRVEVRTPDGQILSLVHVRLGEFVGTWRPSGQVAPKSKLRVVAVDRALNESTMDVEVP